MMKKIYRLLWLFIGLSAGMTSCIHDETTGFERELSEITVKVSGEGVNEDGTEADVQFMHTTRITASAEQTMDGYELSYEWRAGYITGYEGGVAKTDSMCFISKEPVLVHSFDKTGSYRVRLRVSNEHGSTFHYMTVNVFAGMERGLLVLSMDETKAGRLSFCAKKADELLEAKIEDFETDIWSRINSNYTLSDVQDMLVGNSNSVFVLSKSQQCIYELDKSTLMVLNKIDLTLGNSWNVQAVSMLPFDNTWDKPSLFVLSEDGIVYISNFSADGILEKRWGTDMKCVKALSLQYAGWGTDIYKSCVAIDNEQEKIVYYGYHQVNSGDAFKGEEIVNYGLANTKAYVVSRSKSNPDRLRVTSYASIPKDPSDKQVLALEDSYEYTQTSPLTLTLETTLVYNDTYRVFHYYNKNKVYRWSHLSKNPLPSESDAAAVVPAGEITCMAQSADDEYLYVGVYDAAASGLKGNVYIYKAETLELVKSFIGVADKPVKLFYKDVQ